jgi:UDP-N-acetylmuramate--alanine ligase
MAEFDSSSSLNAFKEIHIVGIGGAGMSAIGRVLKGKGIDVHGSDQAEGLLIDALRQEGIQVALGHAPEHVGSADVVLASSAIPDDNVELTTARNRDIPVMRRPDFLPILTSGYRVIAVAGAHGKTTVTGMIALAMLKAGLDPTFIIGGVIQTLGTNARVGHGPCFLIEADEYQHTFLSLEPEIAVITNIEHDHPDIFPNLRFLRLAFGDFVDRIRPDGLLVACNDDKVAHAVAASFHANGGRLALYGCDDDLGLALQAKQIHANEHGGVDFKVSREGQGILGEVSLQIPGRHNVLNALAALLVAEELGIAMPTTSAALADFTGMARRFEQLGEVKGVTVIDDYAHHPTQIRAVLAAARQRYPTRRIIAVWQPHTFSRVKALREAFATAFTDADHVWVLPIYAAREADDASISHRDLSIAQGEHKATVVDALEEAVQTLAVYVQPGDVVLLMGAGNEYVVGQQLLDILTTKPALA